MGDLTERNRLLVAVAAFLSTVFSAASASLRPNEEVAAARHRAASLEDVAGRARLIRSVDLPMGLNPEKARLKLYELRAEIRALNELEPTREDRSVLSRLEKQEQLEVEADDTKFRAGGGATSSGGGDGGNTYGF